MQYEARQPSQQYNRQVPRRRLRTGESTAQLDAAKLQSITGTVSHRRAIEHGRQKRMPVLRPAARANNKLARNPGG
jgi:hypothetical protein